MEKESDPKTLQLWLTEIVERFSIMLGAMITPVIEKMSPDEFKTLQKEVRQRSRDYYTKKFDAMELTDRSMEAFGKMMYNHLIGPLTVAGQREAVTEKTPKRLVTEAYACVENDVWQQISDRPHLICELDAVFMMGMADAFNPNLVYKQYGGPVKDGQIQWGLPWGTKCCQFIMEDIEPD